MIASVFQVALGGALGAALRYLSGVALIRAFGPGLPYGTLTVNILGSFLMGVFVIYAAERGATHLAPFVMTGLLGGFTTFSAFSLDAVTMFERGEAGIAAGYILGSVILSIAALFLGMTLAKGVFA